MAILRVKLRRRVRGVGTQSPRRHAGREAVQYLLREGPWRRNAEEVVPARDVTGTGYLTRQTPATQGRSDLRHQEVSNLPGWAKGDARVFFEQSYRWEGVNRRFAMPMHFSLPRELSHEEHLELARDFLAVHLPQQPYLWVKHEPVARDGLPQPHIHILASSRTMDGIERPPHQFFKLWQRARPERGGAQKDVFWKWQDAPERIRNTWASLTNYHLERAGRAERVDPRRLKDQGIDREPEPKGARGPSRRDHAKEYAAAEAAWGLHKRNILGIEAAGDIGREALVERLRSVAHLEPPKGYARTRPTPEELGVQAHTLTSHIRQMEEARARLHAQRLRLKEMLWQGRELTQASLARVYDAVHAGSLLRRALDEGEGEGRDGHYRAREGEHHGRSW
jgi:hypothetical protein